MTVTTLADDAAELAALAGVVLDAGQRQALRNGMEKAADGRWVAWEVRWNDQAVLLARELAGLFLLDERILHTAREYGTVAEAFRRAEKAITGSRILQRRVKRITRAAGAGGIELTSGARARFAPWRSSRGYACDCLIAEGAASLGENVAMLLPYLAGRPDPQIWYGG